MSLNSDPHFRVVQNLEIELKFGFKFKFNLGLNQILI